MPRTAKSEPGRNVSRRVFPHSGLLRLDIEDQVIDGLRRIETLAALLSASSDGRSQDCIESTLVAEATDMIAAEIRRIREAITK